MNLKQIHHTAMTDTFIDLKQEQVAWESELWNECFASLKEHDVKSQ